MQSEPGTVAPVPARAGDTFERIIRYGIVAFI